MLFNVASKYVPCEETYIKQARAKEQEVEQVLSVQQAHGEGESRDTRRSGGEKVPKMLSQCPKGMTMRRVGGDMVRASGLHVSLHVRVRVRGCFKASIRNKEKQPSVPHPVLYLTTSSNPCEYITAHFSIKYDRMRQSSQMRHVHAYRLPQACQSRGSL